MRTDEFLPSDDRRKDHVTQPVTGRYETVFEKILEFGIDKYDLNDENYVIKCVSIDPIEIINIVLKVHLNIDKKITNLEQINIKTINREVKKSNISADLKSSFYSFLIDPICAIELLCKDVKFIYNQVSSLYNLKFTKIKMDWDLNRSPKATQFVEEEKNGNLDNDLLNLMPR